MGTLYTNPHSLIAHPLYFTIYLDILHHIVSLIFPKHLLLSTYAQPFLPDVYCHPYLYVEQGDSEGPLVGQYNFL